MMMADPLHKHLDALLSTINSSSDQKMAVGPVITHKKTRVVRISCGPKVKALGLLMA